MPLRSKNPSTRALGGAAFALGLFLGAPPSHAQRAEGGPFAGLAGSWSGTGSISLSSGDNERIRCRATYAVGEGGNSLQQNLRCASDSYRFDLTSTVSYSGGALSGTWTEASRNASGSVSGSASGGQIQARVDGPTFQANLSLSTRGDRQSVSIRSQGTELSSVSITLARGR